MNTQALPKVGETRVMRNFDPSYSMVIDGDKLKVGQVTYKVLGTERESGGKKITIYAKVLQVLR